MDIAAQWVLTLDVPRDFETSGRPFWMTLFGWLVITAMVSLVSLAMITPNQDARNMKWNNTMLKSSTRLFCCLCLFFCFLFGVGVLFFVFVFVFCFFWFGFVSWNTNICLPFHWQEFAPTHTFLFPWHVALWDFKMHCTYDDHYVT